MKNPIKVIHKNLELFNKDPINGVSIGIDEDNLFKWNIIIIGPKDSPYEGGIFNCKIEFPNNFPLKPPVFTFLDDIYHPNIYTNGKVCISILHQPGNDVYGYESSAERWRPVHTINSILISIICLLGDPNCDSPANINAAISWRKDKKLFQENVNKCIRKTHKN